MKTAVIMSRVSSDEQAQGYSLGVQEEALTRYCEKNNIQIIQKVREDHSAKDFNRPEFIKFLAYARKHKGEINFLLITSWDRFSRNITDAFLTIRTLKNLGITVQAIEQQTDLTIPENKAMLALFLAIPEIDNERRSIKIKGGMQAALKSGRWCMKAPRGYKNERDENNRPVIIPNNDAIYIQRIFKGISEGKRQVELRMELKKEGFEISKTNFSSILYNPVYMGKVKILANGEEPEHLVEGVHESIVNEELFYRVQKILKDRLLVRNLSKYSTLRPELFLRGNLICSLCGKKLTGSPSKGKCGGRYFYYHCNHCGKERYRAEKANETINRIISDLKFTKEANEVYMEMVKLLILGSDKDRNKKIKNLEIELEKLDQRLKNTQDLYIDGGLPIEDFNTMRNRYSSEKNMTELKLNEIKNIKSGLKKSLEKGVGVLSNLGKTYENANLSDKRRIISSIFPENLVFDGEKCQTPRINEVLRLILLIDKDNPKIRSGQISEFLDVSAQVELAGVEPASRQGDHMLSTCLVLLDCRDRSAAEQPSLSLVPVFLTIRPEQSSGQPCIACASLSGWIRALPPGRRLVTTPVP